MASPAKAPRFNEINKIARGLAATSQRNAAPNQAASRNTITVIQAPT